MKNDKLIKVAINAVFALTTASTVIASTSAIAAEDKTEKCYGIVRAGMNDCAYAKQSCAGSATKDSEPDAYLFVPKGLCTKIVGGNLKAPTDSKK